MTVTSNFFRQPRLRPGVFFDVRAATGVLRYRQQEYELEFESGSARDAGQLLSLLREGGRSFEQLTGELPGLGSQLYTMVRDLDRIGLVTETDFESGIATSGSQFYRELYRFVQRAKRHYAERPFQLAVRSGEASREQLIGYVLEYYHIVRMCPGLLAPALAHHENDATRRLLQDFFVSELHHDRLIERALAAVAIEPTKLGRLVPLTTTFSLCCSLGTYAREHPMTFKAALFLFEEPDPEFNQAFVRNCQTRDLPEAFYAPILEHAHVNQDGDHESISETLFAHVPCISPEEQQVVRRHMAILVETLVLMERQLLEYYGTTTNTIPRVFD